jgi:hypothetical protein
VEEFEVSTKRKALDHEVAADEHRVTEELSRSLRWWRSTRADNFHALAVSRMRSAVIDVAMLGEPRWRDAATGDADAAIAIVLAMGVENSHSLKFDICMTALVLAASEGDVASCLVVAHVLRHLPNGGRREKRLATSWLVHAMRRTSHATRGE